MAVVVVIGQKAALPMSIRSDLSAVEGHGITSGDAAAYERDLNLLPRRKAVKGRRTASIKRRLGTPVQTGKVRVFTVLVRESIDLSSFALKATFFLLALFHLARFLAISFCERCFAWSCDDALLGLRHMNARTGALRRPYADACASMRLRRWMVDGTHPFDLSAIGLPVPDSPWR